MDSGYCQYSTFDLFSKPPTETGLEGVHDQEILPLTALSSASSTVDFVISGDGEDYTDLSSLRLYLQVQITKYDGSKISEDDKISLIKLWPQSLFRQCDMFLNGTLVTTSSNLYHYAAYVASVLSFPKTVKDYQLSVLEHFSEWSVKAKNPSSEALIRLHLPLCNQQRFLPNGVHVKLRLLRAPNAFYFLKQAADKNDYSLTIDRCTLWVRRITPSSSLLLDHASQLQNINMIYPIQRLWPKFFTLGKGIREYDLNNVCNGQLPNRILLGFVKSDAFSGTMTTNPYNFENFKLDYIALQSNGKSYPAVPLEIDFDKQFCRRAYHMLHDTLLGPCTDNESLGLSLHDYASGGCCFYGFTLSRSLSGVNESIPARENGYINAKLRFREELKDNVNALFFLEFNNNIEIDSARNVYLDYAA